MKSEELVLDIITPAKSAFNGIVKSITLPGTMGDFQVLKSHAPLRSTLELGRIKVITSDGALLIFAESGGVVEVKENQVLILANSLEIADDIDIDRATRSKKRAEERLAEKGIDLDLTRAEASLERSLNRIKVKQYAEGVKVLHEFGVKH